MGRNKVDFQGYSLRYRQDAEGDHDIIAKHPSESEPVGYLTWDGNDGEVLDIHVAPEHQRKGLATAMWNHAQKIAMESRIVYPQPSAVTTDDGDKFFKSLGIPLPPRIPSRY